MYHQVGAPRPGSALNKWRVKEEDFNWQLDALLRRGYRGAALNELFEAASAGCRRAVLTFDDGYRGVFTRALPALLDRGFKATVFVVTDRLGGINDWDGEAPGETLLSADEIRELHANGIEIGSHGATHRALTRLSDGELSREVAGSREALERLVDARPRRRGRRTRHELAARLHARAHARAVETVVGAVSLGGPPPSLYRMAARSNQPGATGVRALSRKEAP